MEIRIDLTGNAGTYFSRIQEKLKDLTPVMEVLGEIAQESIETNFEVGGRPEKWKALSEDTIIQREKLGKWPGPILVRSGKAGGLTGGLNYRAMDDRGILSANKVYAAIHHFGAKKGEFGQITVTVPEHEKTSKKGKKFKVKEHTKKMNIPGGDIPARPYMVIQDDDVEEMTEVLKAYLVRLA